MKAQQKKQQPRVKAVGSVVNDLPLYVRFHTNKILIGVIVVCLGILLIRYRMSRTDDADFTFRSALDLAQQGIFQLQVSDRTQPTDIARIQERRKLASDISTQLDQVFDNTSESSDPAMRARAWTLRGDFYWTLANLPAMPGAATQPALAMPQKPAEYLESARAAYDEVLAKYDSDKISKASALFGLAAIEENLGNWDKAIAYYNAITSDAQMPAMYKNHAQMRLANVSELRSPVFFGSFSSTQPTTMDSTMVMPTSQSTTQAATTMPGNQAQ
jgi:tetratricopeptide (TPR) repeat protein